MADIPGIVINNQSKYGALAASVFNTYFDNGLIPIGARRPLTDEITKFTLISLGFLTNLIDLLEGSADETSSLAGPALISYKVKEQAIMGGQYPSGKEFNFAGEDPASTYAVIIHWPRSVAIAYSGFELGGSIFGRDSRRPTPPFLRPNSGTRVDTALFVSLPEFANEIGYNRVSADGSNAWVDDTRTPNQYWLKGADEVTNLNIARLLDSFFSQGPVKGTLFATHDGFQLEDQGYSSYHGSLDICRLSRRSRGDFLDKRIELIETSS
ncbi:nucleoside hydrolase [Xylaria sp. CBS 124048]|nr:nucleoside hydrolase [Xylaria sp. CBS 124048]